MYTVLAKGVIAGPEPMTSFPPDPSNSDYQKYLLWVASGNTATTADTAVTSSQQIEANKLAIQAALDAKAQERGYDDIRSACSYASATPVVPEDYPEFVKCEEYRIEANALQSWLAQTWATAFAYIATVQDGTNPMPSVEEAISMMPEFTWPS